jgi:drug/metabolite transporter (DMT)-like permease
MSNVASGAIRSFYARPYLLLVLCMLCWAGNIVIMRASAWHIPPMQLSFIRWTMACIIFLPITWPYLKKDWPLLRATLIFMIVLSLTGMAVPNQLTLWSLSHTTALNALLLQSVTPLLIAAWAIVLYRERLTWLQLVGLVISLAGVVVIVGKGDWEVLRTIAINPGDAGIFIGLIVFGFYSAITKKRPAVHPFSFLWSTMAISAVAMIPLSAYEYSTGSRISPDWTTFTVLAYLTVFGSVVSLLFFNRAIELIGPNRTAPFMNLTPVFGSVMAIVFLAETPQLFHVVGYALVLFGLFFGTRRESVPLT